MNELKLELKKLEIRGTKQFICINQNAGDCCTATSGIECCTSRCC